jgi:hypothetical protein
MIVKIFLLDTNFTNLNKKQILTQREIRKPQAFIYNLIEWEHLIKVTESKTIIYYL